MSVETVGLFHVPAIDSTIASIACAGDHVKVAFLLLQDKLGSGNVGFGFFFTSPFIHSEHQTDDEQPISPQQQQQQQQQRRRGPATPKHTHAEKERERERGRKKERNLLIYSSTLSILPLAPRSKIFAYTHMISMIGRPLSFFFCFNHLLLVELRSRSTSKTRKPTKKKPTDEDDTHTHTHTHTQRSPGHLSSMEC